MDARPGGSLDALQRRQMFEASLESCRFVSAHWFGGLARGLRRVWAERLESGAEALLGPLPPVGAALFAPPPQFPAQSLAQSPPAPGPQAAPPAGPAGNPAGDAAGNRHAGNTAGNTGVRELAGLREGRR